MPNWPATNNVNGLLHSAYNALLAIPAAKVRYVLLVIMAVSFLSLLADMVWMWFPAPAANGNLPAVSTSGELAGRSRPTVDLASMQSWYLFGSGQPADAGAATQASPAEIPADVSVTNLQLVLLGILQADIPENSFAVIQSPGVSDLYKVGSNIPVGNNVTLAKVLVDRVIVNNNGRMESLLLYAETGNSMGSSPVAAPGPAAQVLDHRKNREISAMANNYRNQLLSNPVSLTDVIKVSIAKDAQGQTIGYRVRPGRDRAQFAQFGLQTGDIVTSINGVSLDDPAKAMELYGQLREAKEASFVVRRGSEEINLIVGLNQ